jgi:farnesyl diphosphate synthase
MAFEIIASSNLNINEKIKINLIKKLSECSGHLGDCWWSIFRFKL